jgi:uncharacterized protein YndB with AHSA1/START domain
MADAIETTETSSVTTTVTVEGGPDEVWELLTDGDELSTWLGDEVTLDPVPDGRGHLIDDEGVGREIRVDEVEPGRSISWRWWPDGDDDQTTRVAIELVPGDDRTEIRVTEWVAALHVVPVAASWSDRTLSAELTMLSRHLVLARV